jgi:hypothetical protein
MFGKRKRMSQFITVGVVVRRDDRRGTEVKGNDGDGWSSDGVVLWLGRRQKKTRLSGGESDQSWDDIL